MFDDDLDAVRLANLEGRAVLLRGGRCIDVAQRSEGALPSDPMALLGDFDTLCQWAAGVEPREEDPVAQHLLLGPCVPRPAQIFGIGLNYRDHAQEASIPIPERPMVFTKFPSCVSGPGADIRLTGDTVDWEVELVVVLGKATRGVSEAQALGHVAGYCIGQDISDRRLQFSDNPPQFSLGKSAPGFGPIGPAVTALGSLEDPLDLGLRCDINGQRMQDGRSSNMIFGVPALVAYLSSRCALLPGDLIFTGTPAGVGSVRNPRQYLSAGDVIHSEIDGLGSLHNRCIP